MLAPHDALRLHLRDASNYYYLLRVPDARLPFQGIGPPISADWWEAGCPGSWPEDKVYHGVNLLQRVFLAVLMGDLNGVMIGQEVHRNMLLRNDAFRPEEEVIYGAPAPPSKTWAGIYIDDFGVLAAVSRKTHRTALPEVARDREIMKRADETYVGTGVPIKPSKKLLDLLRQDLGS